MARKKELQVQVQVWIKNSSSSTIQMSYPEGYEIFLLFESGDISIGIPSIWYERLEFINFQFIYERPIGVALGGNYCGSGIYATGDDGS